jgi:hypothetical protein
MRHGLALGEGAAGRDERGVQLSEPTWAGPDLWFLADGRLAVTDSRTDTLLLWDTSTATMSARLCALAGRNLTRAEWAEVGPAGQACRRTCPQFPGPPADATLSRDLTPAPVETAPG